MKIKFFELDIRVSELQTTRVSVASWEAPLLQAIWGDNVSFVTEILVERKTAPEPNDEYVRLANRYKGDEPGDPPYVSAVYGQFGPGVAQLARAIEAGVYGGAVTTSERPAQGVPVAGQVPGELTKSVAQLEKELTEARALQDNLAGGHANGGGNTPLSRSEIDTVKAAAPDKLTDAIEGLDVSQYRTFEGAKVYDDQGKQTHVVGKGGMPEPVADLI